MLHDSQQHRLVLFASHATARLFDRLPARSVEFVICPTSNENPVARILYQQFRLPTLVARHRIDVLCSLADVAPLRVKVPVVLKVNSLHHFTTPKAIGMFRSIYRRLMIGASARRARFVVANSRPAASDIQTLLGVSADRIRLIYEAVDDCFAPCEDQVRLAQLLRERYRITDRYLLFVSALYRYKNLNSLIRALGSLVDTGRWTGSLVVAGPDPHSNRDDSEQLAIRLGVADRVTFLGAVPNEHLRELYCGAAVLVYPSASETFGKPIVEAMRCGTPVVASNRGSIPDVAAGAALLIDPDDSEALANAVVQLLEDSDLRTRLRDIGLKRGAEFSWRSVAIGFTKVLEEAVS